MDAVEVTRTNRALNKLSKLYRAAKARELSELGLHPGQDVLLWVLSQDEDGITISALAERLGVEQPTVTRSLSRMEKTGLFDRESVPSDRRQVRVVLTRDGRSLIPQIERVWAELADATIGTLAPDRQRTVVAAMEDASDGLRKLLGESADAVLADG